MTSKLNNMTGTTKRYGKQEKTKNISTSKRYGGVTRGNINLNK